MSVVFSNKFVQVGVGLTLVLVGFTFGRFSQEMPSDNSDTDNAATTAEVIDSIPSGEYQVLDQSSPVELEKAVNISTPGEAEVVTTPVLKDEEDSELNIQD